MRSAIAAGSPLERLVSTTIVSRRSGNRWTAFRTPLVSPVWRQRFAPRYLSTNQPNPYCVAAPPGSSGDAVRIRLVRGQVSRRKALAPHRRDEWVSKCGPAVPGTAADDRGAHQSLEWRAGCDRGAHRRPVAVSLALDPVAERPDGHDVPRVGGAVLELAAQHRDVRVHRPAHHILGVAPP